MAEKNYADMSRSERMTFQAKKRKEVVSELRKNPDALKPKPKVTSRLNTNARRQDGICEDPSLTAARIAFEKEKEVAKTPPPVKPQYAPLEMGDRIAIFNGFLNRTPEFVSSAWNVEMLSRCIDFNEAEGNVTFSSSGLDACYKSLHDNGHLEQRLRHRGQAMPREFPEYTPKPELNNSNGGAARIPLKQPATHQIVSREEAERLRTMPLSELAGEVRRGYNYKRAGEAVR